MRKEFFLISCIFLGFLGFSGKTLAQIQTPSPETRVHIHQPFEGHAVHQYKCSPLWGYLFKFGTLMSMATVGFLWASGKFGGYEYECVEAQKDCLAQCCPHVNTTQVLYNHTQPPCYDISNSDICPPDSQAECSNCRISRDRSLKSAYFLGGLLLGILSSVSCLFCLAYTAVTG